MTQMLTDLETRLASPGGAALRDELAARAQRLEHSLRAHIAAGLPRPEFALWQAAAEAAAAAHEVLAAWPAADGASGSVADSVSASTPAAPAAGHSTFPSPR